VTTLPPAGEATVDEAGAPAVHGSAGGSDTTVGGAQRTGGAPATGAAARPAPRRRPHHTIARVLWSGPQRLYEFYWGEGIADDVPALAYYLVLSLAPFALGLAALEALLLKDVVSAIAVADQLNRFLPEAVHGDIRHLVLGTRDNSPLLLALALFAMLWTTSGGIGVIERCLSRILDVPRHNIVVGRIRNLGLGALVAIAVILASLSTSVVTNLSYELRPGRGFPGPMILIFNGLGSMLVFATIYRYGPLTRMRWRSALLGAVPGGLAIQAVPAVVGLYVSAAAGFAAVQLFLLLAIMLLGLYIVALLLLVGAGIAGRAERRAWGR
jgi:YihY family inner membrane protein